MYDNAVVALQALSCGANTAKFVVEITLHEMRDDGWHVFVLPKRGDVVDRLQVCSQHIKKVCVRFQGRVLWQSADAFRTTLDIPNAFNLMAAGYHDIRIEVQSGTSVSLSGVFTLYADMALRKTIATTMPVMLLHETTKHSYECAQLRAGTI